MQFLMLRTACVFTNYVSSTVENSYPFRTDSLWGNGLGNKKSKEGAYAKWENYCSLSVKICESLLRRLYIQQVCPDEGENCV